MNYNFGLQSLSCQLTGHYLFCLRTSTMVAYLYRVKVGENTQKTESQQQQQVDSIFLSRKKSKSRTLSNNPAYTVFCRFKCLQYGALGCFTIRLLFISFLLSRSTNLKNSLETTSFYFFFKSGGHLCFAKLHLFTATTIACLCLMALFALYLDYALTFNLDDFLIRALQEIMVENGRDFRLLNDGVNGVHWPKVTNVAHLWTLVASYQTLVRGIWTCFSLKFYKNKLEYFPALSGKLRAQMVVFSAIIEAVIVFLNTLACKL